MKAHAKGLTPKAAQADAPAAATPAAAAEPAAVEPAAGSLTLETRPSRPRPPSPPPPRSRTPPRRTLPSPPRTSGGLAHLARSLVDRPEEVSGVVRGGRRHGRARAACGRGRCGQGDRPRRPNGRRAPDGPEGGLCARGPAGAGRRRRLTLVSAGRVGKAHGLDGSFWVEDPSHALDEGTQVTLDGKTLHGGPTGRHRHAPAAATGGHGRSAPAARRDPARGGRADEGEWLASQLVGCEVVGRGRCSGCSTGRRARCWSSRTGRWCLRQDAIESISEGRIDLREGFLK